LKNYLHKELDTTLFVEPWSLWKSSHDLLLTGYQ